MTVLSNRPWLIMVKAQDNKATLKYSLTMIFEPALKSMADVLLPRL